MLVVSGFFENGVFVPDEPLANVKGKQRAVLNIDDIGDEGRQDRIDAWREFSCAVRDSDEILEGEPKRIRFRMPEEIETI
jgi:hypothetical protein